ncbi:MAG: sulfatase [Sedimentisphaeraceae bacterium JB056]
MKKLDENHGLSNKKLNVIMILVDDLGATDLACCGSDFYETPNLDALAEKGMRFVNAWATCPVCSPSRASVMTGKYPARLGLTNFIDHSGDYHPSKGFLVDAPYIKSLDPGEYSLARILKDNGWKTFHVGKWHLGGRQCWPDKHGFDVNVAGCHWGMPSNGYFSPWGIPNLEDGPEGEYLPDRLGDEAVRLIEENAATGKPFYLNYWPYLVHVPIEAKSEKIEKYRRKAEEMGLDKIKTFEEGAEFKMDSKKGQPIKRRLLHSDPIYAAMIESLDENVGKILDAVERTGQTDNTLIIFTSDNGGLATAEGSPTCNAPYAEGKGWMYEGGTREPLIIKLPGVTTPGSISDSYVTGTDYYPTILEAAGLDALPTQHVDGRSFYDALCGKPYQRDAMFWHYPHYGNQGGEPGASVIEGDYKLIKFFEDGRLELYDIVKDVSETNNISESNPEVRDRLHEILLDWQKDVAARLPGKNHDWKQ